MWLIIMEKNGLMPEWSEAEKGWGRNNRLRVQGFAPKVRYCMVHGIAVFL